jgi:hypothetical protein
MKGGRAVHHGATRPGDDDAADDETRSSPSASSNDDWSQRAGFSVWLDVRTDDHGKEAWKARIYHEETGEETVVDSESVGGWPTWLLSRIGLDRPPSPQRAATGEPPITTASLSVDVAQVHLIGSENDGVTDREHIRIEADIVVQGMTNLHRVLGAALLRATMSHLSRSIASQDHS